MDQPAPFLHLPTTGCSFGRKRPLAAAQVLEFLEGAFPEPLLPRSGFFLLGPFFFKGFGFFGPLAGRAGTLKLLDPVMQFFHRDFFLLEGAAANPMR